MNMVTVRTPSRLHFGLLGRGNTSGRQFGGFGLMVERPGLELRLTPSATWSANGPHADRVLASARSIADRLSDELGTLPTTRLEVVSAPNEHVGLGVGTQLTLAIASGLLEIAGRDYRSPARLAALTERGNRSGIGLHGFLEGGFIVDGGKGHRSPYPTCIARQDFPQSWNILIATPTYSSNMHGANEHEAFRALGPVPESVTNALCRSVLLDILPSIIEKDLEAFGHSLQAVQRIVGANFAPVQGGVFSSPEVARVAQRLDELGLKGIGQSSWGPTLYAFSDADEHGRETMKTGLLSTFDRSKLDIVWTRASNAGATIMKI